MTQSAGVFRAQGASPVGRVSPAATLPLSPRRVEPALHGCFSFNRVHLTSEEEVYRPLVRHAMSAGDSIQDNAAANPALGIRDRLVDLPSGFAHAWREVAGQRKSNESDGDSFSRITEQRRQWALRPVLRMVYQDGFRRIVEQLKRDESGSIGKSIELGCGGGFFKEYFPEIEATDVMLTPWADRVADAQHLPYADASLRNIVMFDVQHHIANLPSFFDCLSRALEPAGRIILLEPFVSPLSRFVYKRFHREPYEVDGNPFLWEHHLSAEPMDGNNGVSRAVFFTRRGLSEFKRRWPHLLILKRQRMSLFAYPMSGGFSGPVLLPHALAPAVLRIERYLENILGWFAAYRCLVVLQKQPRSAGNSPPPAS